MSRKSAIDSWRVHISQWEQSGQTQTEYCKDKNICSNLFSKWKSKIKSTDKPNTSFLEVPQIHTVDNSGNIRLIINDRYFVELTSGFDKSTLADLLEVLEKSC